MDIKIYSKGLADLVKCKGGWHNIHEFERPIEMRKTPEERLRFNKEYLSREDMPRTKSFIKNSMKIEGVLKWKYCWACMLLIVTLNLGD